MIENLLLQDLRHSQNTHKHISLNMYYSVALPGTEVGTLGDDGERFIDNRRITGIIPDMLEEAVEFVRKNSRINTATD